jgi:hypothetical protein
MARSGVISGSVFAADGVTHIPARRLRHRDQPVHELFQQLPINTSISAGYRVSTSDWDLEW